MSAPEYGRNVGSSVTSECGGADYRNGGACSPDLAAAIQNACPPHTAAGRSGAALLAQARKSSSEDGMTLVSDGVDAPGGIECQCSGC
jgi:hypothetical protein